MAAADPAFADNVIEQSFTSDSSSSDGDDETTEEYANMVGAISFSALAVFFLVISIFWRHEMRLLFRVFSGFALIACAIAAFCIIQQGRFPWSPRKTFSETRVVLREMKKVVSQAEEQKEDLIESLNRIFELDQCVRRMASARILETYTRDWQRWEALRERYGKLDKAIPSVNLNAQ